MRNKTKFTWYLTTLLVVFGIYMAFAGLGDPVYEGITPQFPTAKLTNLTNGYLPYHVSDAAGLANSVVYTDGTNVGIGTASPSSNLAVTGGTNAVVGLFTSSKSDGNTNAIQGSATTANSGDNRAFYAAATNSGAGSAFSFYGSSGVLYNAGNVGIAMTNPSVELDVTGDIEYTGTITDVSDIRLKENIEQIADSLIKLQSIRGVQFNMIGKDRTELGILAQEVKSVFPEAVKYVDGDYLGVSYPQLIAPLIGAMQDLTELIFPLLSQQAAQMFVARAKAVWIQAWRRNHAIENEVTHAQAYELVNGKLHRKVNHVERDGKYYQRTLPTLPAAQAAADDPVTGFTATAPAWLQARLNP